MIHSTVSASRSSLTKSSARTPTVCVSYYWDGQNKAGKAATVAVGALAGWYGAMQAIQIYNTVKSIFIELKNAYAQTKANIAASQQQDAGITDPIVAAAA